MTIREMRWLLELKQQMNFTKAAEILFVTQSSLSQCVQRIEKEVGFQIFSRDKRQIGITENGKSFLAALQNIVWEYDKCLDGIYARDHSPFSEIKIGVTPYVSTFLSEEINQIQKCFPDVKIRIYENSTYDLINKFEDGTIQILSTNTELGNSLYTKYILNNFRIFILLRKNSPVAGYAKNTGNEYKELDPIYLKDEPLALTSSGIYSRQMALNIIKEAGFHPEFVQSVNRPVTLCHLAITGHASSIYPLSKEIKNIMAEHKDCIFAIPEQYISAKAHRYLYCKKTDMDRFPIGFCTMLEHIFHKVSNSM